MRFSKIFQVGHARLTANAFDDDIRHTREAGMDAHLAKPYTRKQIQEKVESWL